MPVLVALLLLVILAIAFLFAFRWKIRRDAAGIARPIIEFHRLNFGDLRMDGTDDKGDDDKSDDDDGDGDDDKSDDDDGDGDDDKSDDDDGKDALGDKGKKALDRMKAQRNATRRELREWKALGLSPGDVKKILDERGKKNDDAPDPEKIREQARNEVQSEVRRERVIDKIEAKAGARFNLDPEDVAALLLRRHSLDDFLDGDKIDTDSIVEALDELLEDKPNLASGAQSDGKKFKGKGGDGGTRKGSGPAQLTRDDLKRMSPQEIEKARTEGRLKDLLTGNTT